MLKCLMNQDNAEEESYFVFLLKIPKDIYWCLIGQKKYGLQFFLENMLQ